MFEIDLKSHRSIYEQVVDNMKGQILAGVIVPDAKLPSVRDLSKMLTVNPNTVQKAFRELERQGYIYTVAGKGTFASAPSAAAPDPALVYEVRARLAAIVRELYYLTRDIGQTRIIVDDELAALDGAAGATSSAVAKPAAAARASTAATAASAVTASGGDNK
ncbi:MAG: GntR family transcriptional regulator [Clostridiales Family XIII bacterium]|jgi:GntR family transcriptional regulator|nr:GntR family transcriptional regulator [Clostridiales Family XIII bacterium]